MARRVAAPADTEPAQPHTPVRIRALLPTLQPSLRRVAEQVLADPARAATLTVTELAAACDTSETTVIRFCKALGLPGYPQLRLALAAEAGRAEGGRDSRVIGSDIGPGDDMRQVVEKIAFADARAVEETASQLDIAVLERVVDALARARRVDVYGVGASAFAALDFQQKLHRIGRVAFAWNDTHIALTSAALLGPRDVAVGISHTGVTGDTIDALAEARAHGATTVALTNFPRSPIARVADHVLTTAARETTFRSGAMASRLAQLTVIDCLFVGVAQRRYAETLAALEVTRDAVRPRRVTATRTRR
jgi:DNA-binding MurR/RpiR family transcriptional regulator